jgi:hypothetical protein
MPKRKGEKISYDSECMNIFLSFKRFMANFSIISINKSLNPIKQAIIIGKNSCDNKTIPVTQNNTRDKGSRASQNLIELL